MNVVVRSVQLYDSLRRSRWLLHRSGIKGRQRVQLFISSTDMTEHLSTIKKLASQPFPALKRQALSGASNIIDIREETQILGFHPTVIRRIYVKCSDSKKLSEVGWVINDKLSFCLECLKEFGLWGRHHCRGCGQLVCSECSSHFAPLSECSELGKLRMCAKCHPWKPAVCFSYN